jgi:citronellyl-CoA synthetase
MTPDGLLQWSDMRRGLGALVKKAPAMIRTAARMGLTPVTAHRSLATLFEERARTHGHRPAVKSDDGDLTYAQLNARANRLARVLAGQGAAPGDAVAVMLDDRPELLVAVLACAKLGAVAAMLNVNQRRAALAHSLACARPVAAVVGEEHLASYSEVAPDAPLVVVAASSPPPSPAPTRPPRVAWPSATAPSTSSPRARPGCPRPPS